MNILKAEKALELLNTKTINRYNKYWKSITPKTNEEIFKRYLFSVTSVHTNWEGNVRGYNAIKDFGWKNNKNELLRRLTEAKCGMQNARTKYIWDFTEQFWADPESFYKVDSTFVNLRNKLVPIINGIGIAKVSFVLEMIHPLKAELSCIDTHGIQLYELEDVKGFKSKKEVDLYHQVESHWVTKAMELGASPYIARCIFWNNIQNQENCRYWSYVLEN